MQQTSVIARQRERTSAVLPNYFLLGFLVDSHAQRLAYSPTVVHRGWREGGGMEGGTGTQRR